MKYDRGLRLVYFYIFLLDLFSKRIIVKGDDTKKATLKVYMPFIENIDRYQNGGL